VETHHLSETSGIPLIDRAKIHLDQVAINSDDATYTYKELLGASSLVASRLLGHKVDLEEKRIAFMVPPSFDYVAIQWGIWKAGGIAVPLGLEYPAPELEHIIDNAGASEVLAHPRYENILKPITVKRNIPLTLTTDVYRENASPLPFIAPERRAMILYTSGTTGKPKGVVTTHRNIEAQITSLIEAWAWQENDSILLALPLHHVHGIINVVACSLWAGARCVMLPRFDAETVWNRLLGENLSLFMGVPTIYARLTTFWENASQDKREGMLNACMKLRLMVSGSAALPVPLLEKWKLISGHVLLERYGMTEIGMALSNPYLGERKPGFVGTPLPQVDVQIVDEDGKPAPAGTPGELFVRGPAVFSEYWNNTEATITAFQDGWFRTGDVTVIENGIYRILGRQSIDIIKTGGFKVSALEVEEVLLNHPAIDETAVVGVEDFEWGQRVCAVVVLREGNELTLGELRAWAKERLAPYKVPSHLNVTGQLPRNAMGKVVKPELVERLQTEIANANV
jgi:malonyl-CoA/methylmalonyl-CoA synthetase